MNVNYSVLLTVLVLAAFAWFLRPLFHGFFMAFYKNPIIIELILIWFVAHRLYFKRRSSYIDILGKDGVKSVGFSMASITFLLLLFMLSGPVSTIFPQVHVVDNLGYNSINILPETKENVRLMPYEVAYRYSKDSLQLSQYRLGTGNLAIINSSLRWMFPLVPDGAVIQFTLKNKGIVYVDATTQEKNSQLMEEDMNIGESMLIFDNLNWNLFKKKFWVELDDPFYIVDNGEIYTVVSAVSYSRHQKYGLFYAVPEFAGVFLVNSKGKINFLSPEEAKTSEVLKGNRLFPEGLARFYADSYQYKKGIINKFIIHEDQIDIQDIGSRKINKQPFLMDTADGLKWFVSAEPYGQSHGIFKIFLIDAVDGNIDLYEIPANASLTGPVKAADFVRRANPIVDWTRFKIVEPLPFITDSTLYWKVVVIPYDAAGIAYQAFVNSHSNDVIELNTNNEIQQFIISGNVVKGKAEEKDEETETVTTIEQIKEKLRELEALVTELES